MGRSCLRDILSRGIYAYLASRVDRISASPLDFETLKWLNPNRHIRNQEISTLRLIECHSTRIPRNLYLSILDSREKQDGVGQTPPCR